MELTASSMCTELKIVASLGTYASETTYYIVADASSPGL